MNLTPYIIRLCATILGLILTIIISKNLGADVLGIYSYFNKIEIVLGAFVLFASKEVFQKYFYQKSSSKYQILKKELLGYLISNNLHRLLSVWLLCSITFFFYSHKVEFIDIKFLFLLIISSFIFVFVRLISAYLSSEKKLNSALLLDNFLPLSLFLISILIFRPTQIEILLLILIVSRAIVFLGIISSERLSLINSHALNTEYKKEIANYRGKVFTTNISSLIQENLDLLVVGLIASTKDIALYAVCSRITLIPSIFMNVIGLKYAPGLSEIREVSLTQARKLFFKLTRLLFSLAFIFLAMIFFLGERLLSLWGEEYIDAKEILLILAIGQSINMATGISGVTLNLYGGEKINSLISSISLLIYIPSIIFFAYKFGITGIALLSCGVISIQNILKYYFLRFRL